MKKLAILQNADFEKSGRLTEWARALGFVVKEFRAYEGELPGPEEFTHLVVLGTPHSVHEISGIEWLRRETALVEQALRNGKHVLGVCFGAQLLALLLGGAVSVGSHAEIGWHAMPSDPWPSHWPAPETSSGQLFYWHREVFAAPASCAPLGKTAAGYVSGFWQGRKVLALAGHLEITPELVNDYIRRCWSEQSRGPYAQDPEEMRVSTAELASRRETWARNLFTAWATS